MNLTPYLLDFAVFIGIFGILALSLNLEYGFTGLGNFGKVAFFLIGAYTYAILSGTGIPFYLCLIASALTSAIGGLIISLPALRLREDYLAIVTLTTGEILRLIIKSEDWIGGGIWGTTVPAAIRMTGASPESKMLVNIALVFTCLIICFVIIQLLTHSPYGRVIRAIRENEIAAEALGKNRSKYKAQIFMIGSAMAGVAGGLFAQYLRFIDPYMFLPMITFTVWIMVLVGGPANNWGALLGAVLVQLFDRGTNLAKDYLTLPIDPINLQYILFGILIILVLLYKPQGLLKESKINTKALRLARARNSTTKNRRG